VAYLLVTVDICSLSYFVHCRGNWLPPSKNSVISQIVCKSQTAVYMLFTESQNRIAIRHYNQICKHIGFGEVERVTRNAVRCRIRIPRLSLVDARTSSIMHACYVVAEVHEMDTRSHLWYITVIICERELHGSKCKTKWDVTSKICILLYGVQLKNV